MPRVSWRQNAMRLTLGFQDSCDRRRPTRPVRGLGVELSPSRAREAVVLRASRVGRLTPLGVEPSSALETVQRGEQRAGVDLEHAARDLLDAAGDAEPVHRLQAQRFEDEHVERALNDVGLVGVSMMPPKTALRPRYRRLILIVKM